MKKVTQPRTVYVPTGGVDGISCAGLMLAGFLIFSLIAAAFSQGDSRPVTAESDLSATATATAPALAAINSVSSPAPFSPTAAVPPPTHSNAILETAPTASSPTATGMPTASPTASDPTPVPATATPPFIAIPTYTPDAVMPLPTPSDNYSLTVRVPILMYHYISTPPEEADRYRVDLSVEPVEFRRQMEYLAANGYTTIDLYDLILAITNKQPLPPKPVILTFDDGYRDQYLHAFPVLRDLGLKATFFVVTEFADQGLEMYMNWSMLEEMAAAGMRIEPHTKTHPNLAEQEYDYVIYQILGSLQTVEAHIGYQPRFFAYPGGTYDDLTISVLQAQGFWGAVTTRSGKTHTFDDRYEWRRLRVRHDTPLAEFIDLVQ